MRFEEEMLTAYLDNELSSQDRALVEQTIAEQPQYAQLLKELSSVRAVIATLPPIEPSVNPIAGVQQRIASQRATPVSQPRETLGRLVVMATAACLMLAIGVYLFRPDVEDGGIAGQLDVDPQTTESPQIADFDQVPTDDGRKTMQWDMPQEESIADDLALPAELPQRAGNAKEASRLPYPSQKAYSGEVQPMPDSGSIAPHALPPTARSLRSAESRSRSSRRGPEANPSAGAEYFFRDDARQQIRPARQLMYAESDIPPNGLRGLDSEEKSSDLAAQSDSGSEAKKSEVGLAPAAVLEAQATTGNEGLVGGQQARTDRILRMQIEVRRADLDAEVRVIQRFLAKQNISIFADRKAALVESELKLSKDKNLPLKGAFEGGPLPVQINILGRASTLHSLADQISETASKRYQVKGRSRSNVRRYPATAASQPNLLQIDIVASEAAEVGP